MITLMQRALAYFAKKEQKWYSKKVMRYLHKKSGKFMKQLKPVTVIRTFPDGTKQATILKLYKGQFHIPQEWIKEQKNSKELTLVDNSKITLTYPKKAKGTIHGVNIAWETMDEL